MRVWRGWPRFTFWHWTFGILTTLGVYAALIRREYGWGTAVGARDSLPWGLCSGLNVFCGLALSVGALTVAALIYVLNLRQYRTVLRVSLLAGYIGFLVAAITLSINRQFGSGTAAGFWNPGSILKGILWSVILYGFLVFAEITPDVFGLSHRRVANGIRVITVPLALFAWGLAVLQQSRMEKLILMSPGAFSPLWATPRLTLPFLVSAVLLAIAVTIFAMKHICGTEGACLSASQRSGLTEVATLLLLAYLALRLADFVERRSLSLLMNMRWENYLLALEISLFLGALFVIMRPRGYSSATNLYWWSVLTIAACVANRLNTSITAREAVVGFNYVPHWTEFSIAFGTIALGIALFTLGTRYFPFASPVTDAARDGVAKVAEPQVPNCDRARSGI